MVSDQEIAKGVEIVLRQSDPNGVTSLNGVVSQLEAKLGLDLSHKAGFIRDQINLILRSHPTVVATPAPATTATALTFQQLPPQLQAQTLNFQQKDHFALHPQFQQFASHFTLQPQPHHFNHHHVFPQDLNFRQPVAPPPPQQHQLQHQQQRQVVQNVPSLPSQFPKESTPVASKRRGGPGGLNKVCGVSPELQAIVGEPALPRTEIVKQLWAYIRKHNLQDPSNKRKIICDAALRLVFDTDCTDMFKMNKLLARHITRLEPSKEESQVKRMKVESQPKTEGSDPVASCLVISDALAKFLGTEEREMTQSDASRRVWEYIKAHNLEDPLNSMAILCDEKLKELLGCESISALGVEEMLARHHLFKQS